MHQYCTQYAICPLRNEFILKSVLAFKTLHLNIEINLLVFTPCSRFILVNVALVIILAMPRTTLFGSRAFSMAGLHGKAKRYQYITPLLHSLHRLHIVQRIKCKIGLRVHKHGIQSANPSSLIFHLSCKQLLHSISECVLGGRSEALELTDYSFVHFISSLI